MKVALLGAALVAAAALATPASAAPRVVTNPGLLAQFYRRELSGLWPGNPTPEATRPACAAVLMPGCTPPVIAACPFASPHAPRALTGPPVRGEASEIRDRGPDRPPAFR